MPRLRSIHDQIKDAIALSGKGNSEDAKALLLEWVASGARISLGQFVWACAELWHCSDRVPLELSKQLKMKSSVRYAQVIRHIYNHQRVPFCADDLVEGSELP